MEVELATEYIYIYTAASHKITYSMVTLFTIMTIHIYNTWVTIIQDDTYHNVIVNHL